MFTISKINALTRIKKVLKLKFTSTGVKLKDMVTLDLDEVYV